jgi:hypothetical protein
MWRDATSGKSTFMGSKHAFISRYIGSPEKLRHRWLVPIIPRDGQPST